MDGAVLLGQGKYFKAEEYEGVTMYVGEVVLHFPAQSGLLVLATNDFSCQHGCWSLCLTWLNTGDLATL